MTNSIYIKYSIIAFLFTFNLFGQSPCCVVTYEHLEPFQDCCFLLKFNLDEASCDSVVTELSVNSQVNPNSSAQILIAQGFNPNIVGEIDQDGNAVFTPLNGSLYQTQSTPNNGIPIGILCFSPNTGGLFEIETNAESTETPCSDTDFLDFCFPIPFCDVFIEYEGNCNQYQLSTSINGVPPFLYEWDFNCDGSIDNTEENPFFSFPDLLSNENIEACLTVIDAENCIANASVILPASPCPDLPDLNKLIGDEGENTPTVIKHFGNSIYIAGRYFDGNETTATFTKINDSTGEIDYTVDLKENLTITDFEYNEDNEDLILVGRTEPLSINGMPNDNSSVIIRINSSGECADRRFYDQVGREGLTKIIKHKNPINADFPFYMLGSKSIAIGSIGDINVLFNINDQLTTNWVKEFEVVTPGPPIEVEIMRGLKDLSDNSLLLLGNELSANHGALVHVDGNGNTINSFYYPGNIDWYDAVELSNGQVVLAGTYFGEETGLLYLTEGIPEFTPTQALEFPELATFYDLEVDEIGNLYLTSLKNEDAIGVPDYPVVCKLGINSFGELDIVASKTFNQTGIDFSNPSIFVPPTAEKVFTTYGERNPDNGFGKFDIVMNSFDLDLMENCLVDEPIETQDFAQSLLITQITSFDIPIPPFSQNFNCSSVDYECLDLCTQCTADFTFEQECLTVTVNGTVEGITPSSWEWYDMCDGPSTGFEQNFVFTFPSFGTYFICMKVCNENGVCCSVDKEITLIDNDAPELVCPDIILNTNPIFCWANYEITLDIIDNCDTDFLIEYELSGATSGNEETEIFNIGTTIVDYNVSDNAGNESFCSFAITVEDNQAPNLNCPSKITETVSGCEGGKIIDFTLFNPIDNCGIQEFSCTHQSGDFFECGTTTVVCTATDIYDNESDCSFLIEINCLCAEIVENGNQISCTGETGVYDICVTTEQFITDFDTDCTISASSPLGGISVGSITHTNFPANLITICGTVSTNIPPVSTNIPITVTVGCPCDNGNTPSCSLETTLQTPCCEEVFLLQDTVCKNTAIIEVPLQNCENLFDVQLVNWYISEYPCESAADFGMPFQVTTGCQPLLLEPSFHNSDICIIAEAFLGSADGPCNVLTTNVDTIFLCEPPTCSIESQEFCYFTGNPITPAPLIVNITNPNESCDYSVEWFNNEGNLVGTGLSYQPPSLSSNMPTAICEENFIYEARITTPCGVQSCFGNIKLYNNDSPIGSIQMNPVEPLPLCPGEDLILEYFPECLESGDTWKWGKSNDGSSYTFINENGQENAIYYTNRLYEDIWYSILETNGLCPPDLIDIFIPVKPELTISNFLVTATPCSLTEVNLEIIFSTINNNPCDYIIDWYKDGQLIQSTTSNLGTAIFNYVGDNLIGNYYAIVKDECCSTELKSEVIAIEPEMEVAVAGPCYRCDEEVINLEGIILNEYVGCEYEWYHDNLLVGTGLVLEVPSTMDGVFEFQVINCDNGCTLSNQITLYQPCSTIAVEEQFNAKFSVYPNPFSGGFTINFGDPIFQNFQINLIDAFGRIILQSNIQKGKIEIQLRPQDLAKGIYFLQISDNVGNSMTQKIVQQ